MNQRPKDEKATQVKRETGNATRIPAEGAESVVI